MSDIFNNLVIFEMANNHMGDIEHGLKIIREIHEAVKDYQFSFAFKFQYRNLDTFIHPDYQDRKDIKYIKRFSETRISEEDFLRLRTELDQYGFRAICTPFDEASVEQIIKHDYDIIKIASCSFTDWPLLEQIARTDKPAIASCAGATLEDIDNVVMFFRNRNRNFCLMHCVGTYPTPDQELELNQIDFLRKRYPDITIGFSTHESPDNNQAVMIALAKGAEVLERHVGIATENYPLNQYSSSPEQLRLWLDSATKAVKMCGVRNRRRTISEKEKSDLQGLKRGVFCNKDIAAGQCLHSEDLFYAIPCQEGQLLANDISKYCTFTSTEKLAKGSAVFKDKLKYKNIRPKILEIVQSVCQILKAASISLGDKLDFEISHHYGIDNFVRWGCTIIDCINREYCKKIIILLPGQENPTHLHNRKEETFHVLYGDIVLELNGEKKVYHAGEMIVIERGNKHSFSSEMGAVFEEISTTHYKNDSYYDDEAITRNSERKTSMIFRSSWLTEGVK